MAAAELREQRVPAVRVALEPAAMSMAERTVRRSSGRSRLGCWAAADPAERATAATAAIARRNVFMGSPFAGIGRRSAPFLRSSTRRKDRHDASSPPGKDGGRGKVGKGRVAERVRPIKSAAAPPTMKISTTSQSSMITMTATAAVNIHPVAGFLPAGGRARGSTDFHFAADPG